MDIKLLVIIIAPMVIGAMEYIKQKRKNKLNERLRRYEKI
jgi:hypothetical protein|tara:strand:- start:357 stop:476 length:120 start_codon:yes stop_codon:yes gene_type:complete